MDWIAWTEKEEEKELDWMDEPYLPRPRERRGGDSIKKKQIFF